MIASSKRCLVLSVVALVALVWPMSPGSPATPGEIDDARARGLAWLLSRQRGDGAWSSRPGTEIAATAGAVEALARAGLSGYSYDAGVSSLANSTATSVDSLARSLIAIGGTALDPTPYAERLLAWRNGSLTWGAYERFATSFPDSTLALGAIRVSRVPYSDAEVQAALCAILNGQRSTGGWAYVPPSTTAPAPTTAGAILPTSLNLLEIDATATARGWTTLPCSSVPVSTALDRGVTWLLSQRNRNAQGIVDGGFGAEGANTLFETVLAYRVLSALLPGDPATVAALDYLIASQQSDGGWNGDTFQTAEILKSLPPPAAALLDTDLDGIPDAVERALATNPTVADSRFLARGRGRALLAAIAPATALAGGSPFTLTVTGLDFAPTSVVRWNGAIRPTTVASGTELRATIAANDIAAGGTADVTVFTPAPGTGATRPLAFTIVNPAPTIASLAPATALVGAGATAITVSGVGFVPSSVVRWNGATRATTFVSGTQLLATIATSDVAMVGTAAVTVSTPPPGGGSTAPLTFSVQNPAPSMASLSPSSVSAASPELTLIVNGSGYQPSSVVRWSGADRPTTFVSATRLGASISAADLAFGVAVPVTVFTPAPGGGTSSSRTFSVLNPAPTLSALSPTSVAAGAPTFTLTVTGTNFVPASIVAWNGNNRATTFVTATEVRAVIPAGDLTVGTAVPVTVRTPGPAGGTTMPITFTVGSPPTLRDMSPEKATAGGKAFTLNFLGSNFSPSSVVRWAGSDRATTYDGATKLRASILATDIATGKLASVTVFTPGPYGGVSNALTFTVENPEPIVWSITPARVSAAGSAFTLTVNGQNFVKGALASTSAEARLNGLPLTTTVVSATRLTASVPATFVRLSGNYPLTVENPAPGGGKSNTVTLTVTPISDIVLDNGAPGTSFAGSWAASSAATSYGGGALVSSGTGATYRWTPTIPATGTYQVYSWWPSDPALSTSVPVTLVAADGARSFSVNQGAGGGQWQSLGTFTFQAGAAGYVEVSDGGGPAAADAMRFAPTGGGATRALFVTITGSGSGVVTSNPPGLHCPGTCSAVFLADTTVTLIATPATGSSFNGWTGDVDCGDGRVVLAESRSCTATFTGGDIVLDDGQPGTSFAGSWVGSSAPGSFGAGSLVSAGGSGATYRFTPTIPATWDYNVYIWWPSDSSLAAIVPVTIVSSDSFGGEVRTRVDVDQRTGGGAWHALGHFRFPSGAAGYVEISDENGRAAADAVWFAPVPPMP